MRPSSLLVVTLLLGLAALGSRSGHATTFVMVSDAELVRQAPLVVEGRVQGAARPVPGELPQTDFRVEITRTLKGTAPDGVVTVRLPGREATAGAPGLRLWGSPRFQAGEWVILFLVPRADGTFGVLHLLLGAFHAVPAGGRLYAVRDLGEATELVAGDGGTLAWRAAPLDLPRDFSAFTGWIAEGGASPASYFAPDPDLAASLAERFVLLTASDGVPIRWFDFDNGGGVSFEADARGQEGLPGGGFAQLQTALAAWTNDAGSDVRLGYVGTTASRTTGCASPQRVLRLVFGDPQNEVTGTFDCSAGGVLALGGPCFEVATSSYRGQTYHRAVDGYIVTNDGLGCFFSGSSNPGRAAEELLAHETGHTLGLGHSTVGSALMFANLHNDGRGAALQADDRAAIAALYGNGTTPPPPPAPSGLVATALSASQIALTWQDNATDETGFRIERRTGGGSFGEVASVGANVTAFTAAGLAAATTYEFRVRAVNEQGFSAYSSTASATTAPAGPTVPVAPSNLTATAVSTSRINLSWRDNAANETGYRVERRGYSGFTEVASLPAGSTSFAVTGLAAASPYEFRVRAANAQGLSAYSNPASTNTRGVVGPCVANDTTLCLLAGALRVEVDWKNQHAGGALGTGHAGALSTKTGSFWFFSADNVELLVKALDGGPVNGHYWFFYGALSDVEYWVRVTQTVTGEVAVFHNPPGEICGAGDVSALLKSFAAESVATGLRVDAWPAAEAAPVARATTASCTPGPQVLCLLGGRFEVRVDWVNPRNATSGTGTRVEASDRSGYFWFFDPANLELVVKALDGRAQNGHFWFFYGALSDVEYHLHVRDTVTGTSRTYDNPLGEICGLGDTAAF